MRLARSLSFLAGTAALVQAQVAAAAAPACISEQEVSAMAAFSMPSILQGVMDTCRPSLASDGFFARGGSEMVSRYAARKDAAWPAAKAAFFKMSAAKDDEMTKTVAALPDAALQPFVEAMVGQMVGAKIKSDQCQPIERIAGLLSPLPPENLADLTGFIVTLVAQDTGKKGRTPMNPPICPAK